MNLFNISTGEVISADAMTIYRNATRCKIYPGFTNYYNYTSGTRSIMLRRFRGSELINKRTLFFNTTDEAQNYFESNCGS
jgi:hypothetical protein